MVKDVKRHIVICDMQVANKHIKSCLTSHAFRELQIKMRYYYVPIRMAKVHNAYDIKC